MVQGRERRPGFVPVLVYVWTSVFGDADQRRW